MTTQDDKLKTALKELHRHESTPQFESTWRRAESRLSEKRAENGFRWFFGPAIAAVSAVVVIFLVTSHNVSPSPETLAMLDGLSGPDAGVVQFSDSFDGYDETDTDTETEKETLAYEDSVLTEGLFVGETDFLMNLEFPSWDQGEERNLL